MHQSIRAPLPSSLQGPYTDPCINRVGSTPAVLVASTTAVSVGSTPAVLVASTTAVSVGSTPAVLVGSTPAVLFGSTIYVPAGVVDLSMI